MFEVDSYITQIGEQSQFVNHNPKPRMIVRARVNEADHGHEVGPGSTGGVAVGMHPKWRLPKLLWIH